MGEIKHFPNEPEIPIFDLDPTKDESWDMILDEVYLNGQCVYQYDGKFYTITLEDLTQPPQAA